MQEALLDIYEKLRRQYGPCDWWPADSPFEVCVGAILTQNTNWGNVEKAIAGLKRDALLSPEALLDVPVERLAAVIRPSGFFNVKSVRLKAFVGWLFERHEGDLSRMFEGDWRDLRVELLRVPGIGRETCDAILLYAGGKPSFVVDAYTMRLLAHLNIVDQGENYETVRALFMKNLPEDTMLFNEFHALIVQHGKAFCRRKPVCSGCPLSASCMSVE